MPTRAEPRQFLYRDLIDSILWLRLTGRICKDHGTSVREAERIMDATLGFLKLCGDHPDEAFTPSGKIDIGWHAFLLYTTNYTVFFHQVARRFIHHEPNDDPSAQITARDVTSTVAFMQDHGIKFDPEMWAVPPPESAVSPPAVSAFRSDGLTRRDWGGCQTCWGS